MTNRKIIIVACIVKTSLYIWSDRNWRPGNASSLRTSIARIPPMKKKMNEFTMYRIPIFL